MYAYIYCYLILDALSVKAIVPEKVQHDVSKILM